MSQSKLAAVLQATRLPFLLLTPICLFLGVAVALSDGYKIHVLNTSLALLAALFAHIGVNTINEYFDFKSGLDLKTQKTPFSGGSGALPNSPAAAPYVFSLAILSLIVTHVIGVYLAFSVSPTLIALGALGVFLVASYTHLLNRLPLLCLIAPGLGFGPVIVLGAYVVHSGYLSEKAIIASLFPFFLVNNLLLINQFPDVDADKQVGRHHCPIAYGFKASAWIYLSFLLIAAASLIVGVYRGYFPALSLIACLPLLLGIKVFMHAHTFKGELGSFLPAMGMNVLISLVSPLVLGVTLLVFG